MDETLCGPGDKGFLSLRGLPHRGLTRCSNKTPITNELAWWHSEVLYYIPFERLDVFFDDDDELSTR
jgi:hypothetical protein